MSQLVTALFFVHNLQIVILKIIQLFQEQLSVFIMALYNATVITC